MNQKNKRMLLPLLAIILLVVQMMNPIPVYADGETPPDPPATEETPPPEEQPDPVEETPAPEDATPTEEPSAEATPAPEGDETTETPPAEETGTSEEPTGTEEAPASEPTEEPAPDTEAESPPSEDLTVAEVLEQAPDGTEVVVLNEEGQVEPLVTEAAAEIAANADPIWCPEGQAPIPGNNGCTSSYTSLQDLLNYLSTNEPGQAGTIWIEDSYDSSVNDSAVSGFTLDGATLTTMSNYDLTVQGGWDGNSGSTTITGTSTFNGDYLYITNWNASVTLNDIIVDSVADTGITVETSGDINMENVTSSNNMGKGSNGAYLDNCNWNGTDCDSNGSVSLTGSNAFNGNAENGVYIDTGGNLTLTGTNIFIGNGTIGDDNGIEIYSIGDVYLTGVTANQNVDDGIDVSIFGGGTLTITNSTVGGSEATGNGDDGIDAETDGSVILDNVTAIGNDDNGIYVDASYGDGSLTVTNATLSQNGDEGLEGYAGSDITLTNIAANNNREIGLLLEAIGNIFIGNASANGNGEFGIIAANFIFEPEIPLSPEPSSAPARVYPPLPSSGNITLNQVTANTNGLGGALLESFGDINIFTGQFNGNGANAVPGCGGGECSYYPPDGGIGLAAASWAGTGQIYLENVQASNNYGDGAWLEGDDVVVRNSTFHFNGLGQASLGSDDLYADGLYIADLGGSSAYLECVRANGNAAYGIDIYTGDIVLNGVTAAGNGWDDFNLESDTLSVFNKPCREPKDNTDTTWQIVPVSSGASVGLNCTAYVGTVLVLPNGDEIRLPCPTIGEGNLKSVADDGLPGDLPDGNNYISSFTAQVIKGGVSLEILPASMIVSFVIPEDMLDAELSILYWNGDEWVEVAGAYKTADDRFEASVNYTGVFILVSK